MGFNADSYIAKIAVDELTGKAAGHNQVSPGSGKIEPSPKGKMNVLGSCSRYLLWRPSTGEARPATSRMHE
jgi:hypothetical protein